MMNMGIVVCINISCYVCYLHFKFPPFFFLTPIRIMMIVQHDSQPKLSSHYGKNIFIINVTGLNKYRVGLW